MASGNTLLAFGPADAIPAATNYPQFVSRNVHLVLAYDASTSETAYFEGVMPQNYSDTTGVTIYIGHAAQSATSGTIGWLLAFERIGDRTHDIDSDSFASDQTLTAVTVSGTAGEVDIVSLAITKGANMDSVVAGEGFRLKVARDTANDTATGDAQLLWVEIRET